MGTEKQKHKYNLNQILESLPRAITMNDVIEVLEKEYSISRDTFYRDRNALVNSDQSMTVDRLQNYCDLLEVDIDDIINPLPKKGKSLRQILLNKKTGAKEVKIKNRLL